MMCDRVLLFSASPGRVQEEMRIDLLPPRKRTAPGFHGYVEEIYARMTGRGGGSTPQAREGFVGTGTAMVLPMVSIGELTGLLEAAADDPYHGVADLRKLAGTPPSGDRRPSTRGRDAPASALCGARSGAIRLTEPGRQFVVETVDGRKHLFGRHLVAHVPLAAHILRVLQERESHTAPYVRFLAELEDTMAERAGGPDAARVDRVGALRRDPRVRRAAREAEPGESRVTAPGMEPAKGTPPTRSR